jgi:type II secretion system protein C
VDGTPYQTGEIVTERPLEQDNPASVTYRAGNSATQIDDSKPYPQGNYNPDYLPLLKFPLQYEASPAKSKVTPVDALDLQKIPLSKLPFTLRGVLGLVGEKGFAILETGNQQQFVRVGDSLPKYADVQLLAVGSEHVLLQNGSSLEKLLLASISASSGISSPVAIQPEMLEQVSLKAFRDNAVLDPYRLFDAVQPEPLVAGGKLSGYRLSPGADPLLFVKAGLKPGDVLLAVNGVKLESEGQAVKLLEQYAGAIQLSLTVQRGKEEINLPVNFQEFELASSELAG